MSGAIPEAERQEHSDTDAVCIACGAAVPLGERCACSKEDPCDICGVRGRHQRECADHPDSLSLQQHEEEYDGHQ